MTPERMSATGPETEAAVRATSGRVPVSTVIDTNEERRRGDMGTRDCEANEGGERGRGAKERMGNHLLRGPSYLFELGPTSISCLVRICGSVWDPQAISRTTVMHCTLYYRPEGNPLYEMSQILKVHVNGDHENRRR